MKRINTASLIITLLSITAWGIFYGFHFGWLDDVADLHAMKGAFVNGCTIFDPTNFTIIQDGIQWLYAHVPDFPWFGTLLYAMLTYSIYTSVKLLSTKLKIENILLRVTVAVLFVICFLLESINAINYTEVAILTSGIAIINIYYRLNEKELAYWQIMLYLLPWVAALLVRWNVVFFTTVIVAAILLLQTPKLKIKNYLVTGVYLAICCLLLVVYVKGYLEQTKKYKHIAELNSYLQTIQDAYQTDASSIKTPEDSLLNEAVVTWNFFDKYRFNLPLLQKIGFSMPIRKEVLYDLPVRLKMLYRESVKYNGYHEIYNCNIKFFYVFAINILLLLLQLASGKFNKWQIILAHFIFWFSMLLVGVFLKMENRFFFPLCACYTLSNLLSISARAGGIMAIRPKLMLMPAVFIALSFFGFFMLRQNVIMADELNTELKLKSAFWAELKQLKDKILVYDFHTLYILNDTPFKEVSLPANNENIVANCFYLTHFDCLNDYYISKIGSDSINRIFDYLHANRQKVYMASIDYNIDYLQRYMHTFYHQDYAFIRDTSFHACDNLHHNYLWFPLQFGVYRFKE